jgi:hypothetical protein
MEERGVVNHEWSLSSQLIPSDPKKVAERAELRKERQGNTVQRVISVPDIALRSLLIEMGIITLADLQAKEAELRDRMRVPAAPPVGG